MVTQHSALMQKLQQNTNHLQLDGMINWVYTVMTVFAQRFNICSSKFERSTPPFDHPWLRVWQLQ